ncbi:MAG: peptidylprolyl isomerase [Berryella intestinalis]|uniref:FKBP-type peptidyl-prolyl cis-trans isomerase n=1 Tax=Berryella intestinalis TaxID=1531429 RepID=UPI002A57AAC4|nr:peptidylprolyl isomerase [Berryella intestinalis]MDD7369214.1 peptidylprolyl isomerase [Berryella intestinalis]MDY3130074.1 peptidylprolyl isomerase [Berryella intestinalis]
MGNEGKKVKAHYIGTLDDGTQFDSSYSRNEPIEFTVGAGMMIPGFDKAVAEMEVGQTTSVHIPAAEAYGEVDPNAVQTIPVAQLPGAENCTVGQRVMLSGPGGMPMPAMVAALENGTITFDFNHELAGKDLNFEITLVEVAE